MEELLLVMELSNKCLKKIKLNTLFSTRRLGTLLTFFFICLWLNCQRESKETPGEIKNLQIYRYSLKHLYVNISHIEWIVYRTVLIQSTTIFWKYRVSNDYVTNPNSDSNPLLFCLVHTAITN